MDGENIFENLYYLVWDGRRGLEIRFGKLQIIVGGRGGHLHEIVVPGLLTAVTGNLLTAGKHSSPTPERPTLLLPSALSTSNRKKISDN